FRSEMLTRILGFQGHLYVAGGVLDDPSREDAVRSIRRVPGVITAAPIVEAQAIAMGPSQVSGVLVRGISPEDLRLVPMIAGNISAGSLVEFGAGDYGGDFVVVGATLARALGVAPGDPLTLISPSGAATAFGGTPM